MNDKYMNAFKRFLRVLVYPHISVVIVLAALSVPALILAFTLLSELAWFCYMAYTLSAYALTVVCFRIPRAVTFIKRTLTEEKHIAKYRGDVELRVKFSLWRTLAINTAYAALQLGMGIYHRSVWFYSLAAYYFLLALVRFFLLRQVQGKGKHQNIYGEWRRFRLCGIALTVMNVALVIVIVYMMYRIRGFSHSEITAIALAAYTFFAFISAIVNLVKYQKYKSPVISATKIMTLAAALVSIMTLENAMLNTFGGDTSQRTYWIFTGVTGIVVCILLFSAGVYMIIRATREMREEIKNKE